MSGVAAGQLVTPNVRLVRPLGAGGMGSVWLADHLALKTQVVVKFMLGELRASSSARARFAREAAAAAQVKSPHVVQVFDHGITEDGVPFIVMEHLEGRSLGDLLRAEGPLSPRDVASIVSQTCRALGKVHAAGILHRDIKPDNVFLVDGEGDERFYVKLLDFGIAKNVDRDGGEDEGQTAPTKTGQVVGTPYYMSPEQVTAQKDPDHTSDLWSVGVVAFEALVGQRPFGGNSFGGIAVAIASAPLPVPSAVKADVPAAFDAWFARACARERAERFETARDLADALREAVGGLAPLSSSASGPRPRARDAELELAPTLEDSAAATGAAASVDLTLRERKGRKPLLAVLGLSFAAGVAVVIVLLAGGFGRASSGAPAGSEVLGAAMPPLKPSAAPAGSASVATAAIPSVASAAPPAAASAATPSSGAASAAAPPATASGRVPPAGPPAVRPTATASATAAPARSAPTAAPTSTNDIDIR
ncbi:MAG: serine/threonine protein kinase [Myxococcales bacterium]|nr:serine/threonine protein kinase [Myxococcales bacterium]